MIPSIEDNVERGATVHSDDAAAYRAFPIINQSSTK